MDLIGSMVLDQTPTFPSQGSPYMAQCEGYRAATESSELTQWCNAYITIIFQMLVGLSTLAAGKSEAELSQSDRLLETLQATIHTTLSLPRSADLGASVCPWDLNLQIYETVRVAMLLYLSGPAMFLAGNRRFNLVIPHLRGRLSMLYDENSLTCSVPEYVELFVLVVGAMIEVDDDRSVFVNHLRRVMSARNLAWDDLLRKLWSTAWFDVVWSKDLERLRSDLGLHNAGMQKDAHAICS